MIRVIVILCVATWYAFGLEVISALPLGPDSKERPWYRDARAKWNGNEANFWLLQLPPSTEKIRRLYWELKQNPDSAERTLDALIESDHAREDLIRLLDVLGGMDVAIRFRESAGKSPPSWLAEDQERITNDAEHASYALGLDPLGITSTMLAAALPLARSGRQTALPVLARFAYFDAPTLGSLDGPDHPPIIHLGGLLHQTRVVEMPKLDVRRMGRDSSYDYARELAASVRRHPAFQHPVGAPKYANHGTPVSAEKQPTHSELQVILPGAVGNRSIVPSIQKDRADPDSTGWFMQMAVILLVLGVSFWARRNAVQRASRLEPVLRKKP